jgi:hypothetical protein
MREQAGFQPGEGRRVERVIENDRPKFSGAAIRRRPVVPGVVAGIQDDAADVGAAAGARDSCVEGPVYRQATTGQGDGRYTIVAATTVIQIVDESVRGAGRQRQVKGSPAGGDRLHYSAARRHLG